MLGRPPACSGSAISVHVFLFLVSRSFFRTALLILLSLVYVEYMYMCFPLEHRFLCLVHVLTVAHVLTPVNVHHRRYDAHPTATLVPTLTWFKCIHVNPIYVLFMSYNASNVLLRHFRIALKHHLGSRKMHYSRCYNGRTCVFQLFPLKMTMVLRFVVQ